MKFGEKLLAQRKQLKLGQKEVATAVGVATATIANYEKGSSYPQDRNVYFKLADFFKIDVNYFLTEDEEFLTEAAEKFGKRGLSQAMGILEQVDAMFAGGELSDEASEAFIQEVRELWLDSKRRAREKFTPHKFRKPADSE